MERIFRLYMAQPERGQGQEPERHGDLAPGEGPSAERFRPEEFKRGGGGGPAPTAPAEEHVTYNQDGTRLGEGVSLGTDYNPTAGASQGQLLRGGRFYHPTALEQPMGDTDAPLREQGQSRDQHPGVAGGAGTSDIGTSGALGGDASNVGVNEGELL